MAKERLQKILARAGVASRRAAEGLITAARVRVNGRVVTELGSQADLRSDRIEVDGRRLVAEDLVYLVLHKPRLVVSTLDDPEGRPTVKHLVRDITARVHPVGRLDFHTSGVLLMTNDGELTQGLLHPRREVPKTYIVKVSRQMEERDMERWRTGVDLDDGKTAPAKVKHVRDEGGKTWLEVTIHEGKNQQIRRMGDATGFSVNRLARLSFAGIDAEGLRPGAWRYLTREELVALKDAYGVPRKVVMPGADAPPPPKHGPPRDHRGVRPDARGPRPERRAPRAEGPLPGARPTRPGSRDFRAEARAPRDDTRGPPPDTRGPRPESRGPRPDPRGERPNFRASRPEARAARDERGAPRSAPRSEGRSSRPEGRGGGRPEPRAGRPDTRAGRPDTRGPRPDTRGGRPDTRGPRPDTRGARPDTREPRPETRGARPDTRGPRPETPRSDKGGARSDRGPRRDERAPRASTDGGPRRDGPKPRGDSKNSSAATPSAKTHDRDGTHKRPPSRPKRPR